MQFPVQDESNLKRKNPFSKVGGNNKKHIMKIVFLGGWGWQVWVQDEEEMILLPLFWYWSINH